MSDGGDKPRPEHLFKQGPEQSAVASKAGKRSVEVRRAKKAAREQLKTLSEAMSTVDMSGSDAIPEAVKKACLDNGIACTFENAMAVAVGLRAVKIGDSMAYKAVMDRLKGTEPQTVKLEGGIVLDEAKLKDLRKRLDDGRQ